MTPRQARAAKARAVAQLRYQLNKRVAQADPARQDPAGGLYRGRRIDGKNAPSVGCAP